MNYKIILSIVALMGVINAQAVEQLYHPLRSFVSDQGKVYYPKDKIKIYSGQGSLDSADNLNVSTGDKYIKLNNVGANRFSKVRWTDVNKVSLSQATANEVVTIYYDPRPPVINLYLPNGYKDQGFRFFNKAVTVKIDAVDKDSGMSSVYYSLNEQPYREALQEITVSENGSHVLLVYGVDNVGNVSIPRVIKIVISDAKPVSEILVSPFQNEINGEIILSSNNNIALIASSTEVDIESIFYSIDGSKFLKYTDPLTMYKVAQGPHKISYYSVDKIGNKEDTKNFNFFLDLNPPEVKVEMIGAKIKIDNKMYISPKTSIALISKDNRSGVLETIYTLNKGQQKLYRDPIYADESYIFQSMTYYAVDNAGNTAKEQKTDFILDQSGPEASLNVLGASFLETPTKLYLGATSKLSLQCKDDLTGIKGIKFNLNNNNNQTYTNPFTLEQAGTNNLTITCEDKVGNQNKSNNFILIKDIVPPTLTYKFDKPMKENGKYPLKSKLFIIASDDSSGIEKIMYTINNEAEKEYFNALSFLSSGKYNITLTGEDRIGNKTLQKLTFEIDN